MMVWLHKTFSLRQPLSTVRWRHSRKEWWRRYWRSVATMWWEHQVDIDQVWNKCRQWIQTFVFSLSVCMNGAKSACQQSTTRGESLKEIEIVSALYCTYRDDLIHLYCLRCRQVDLRLWSEVNSEGQLVQDMQRNDPGAILRNFPIWLKEPRRHQSPIID